MIRDELLQLDAYNRERAIFPESFIVEAPAGAGKTELLTQRYLALLNIVNDPEEIVAITFTNKAAAEMRSRILTSLQDAASGVAVDKPHKQTTRRLALAALARSRELGWQLLTQPARLRINTIDSFSSLLARQMPLMSRFGAQPAVVEDAGALYQEAAARALASLESEDNAAVKTALQYFDNDSVRLGSQLADMLARRDQWLLQASQHESHTQAQPGDDQEEDELHSQHAIEDAAAEAFRQLIHHDIVAAGRVLHADLQQQLMPVARYAASNLPCEHSVALLLDWETPLLPRHESLSMWLSVCELLLTREDELRKPGGINVRNGLPATEEGRAWKQQLVDIMLSMDDVAALARLRKLPDLRNIDEERIIVGALAALLKLAAAHLVSVFQEAGEVDFSEVSQRALQALEDRDGPTDLALRLDYRIQHLLVDEFQDTSPMQVNLLHKLMAGWEAGDGRTIFCVGDPMQSIYRFRKADVGLFLQVAEFGIGHLPLESLHLTRNNRSCPEVIDWVNRAFARVFPERDSVTRGAISYREFAATRTSLPGAGVEVHALIAAPDTAAGELAALEARRLADIIEQERAEDPTRSIAVLVRARDHLQALVAEIRRNRPHLRFQAVKVEALAERQSVQDVLALSRALLHRADRVNWLALLRAPWCGLTLADLHALGADDHYSTLWQLMQDEQRVASLSQDGQQRLLHVRHILSEAYAHRGRQSMRRWVESTWLKLGGPQCLWEAGDVRDVQALLDLIDQLERNGRFDMAALQTGIDKLYAAPDVHADGSLQFMTIHNSKGLEFDTVILPGLHRQSAKGDAPLILWEDVALDDASSQLVAAAWRPRHRRDDMPSPYDYLQGLESERSANETARVLYVAATRAIRRLHLVAAVRPNSKDEVKAPNGTFLESLWDEVGVEFLQAYQRWQAARPAPDMALLAPQTATDTLDEAAFIPQLIRLVQPEVAAVLRQPVAAPVMAYQSAALADEDGLTPGHSLDACVGTLAHRYLELMALDGPDAWPAHRVTSLAPAMQHWLAARGLATEQAALGASRVVQLLNTTLASAQGRWVLQRRESGDGELAIARLESQQLATHIVDRTFVEGGVRWVIDYKSVALETDITDAALAAIAQRYRPQLARYAALFQQQGLPVQQAVLFLSTGKLLMLT